MMVEYKQAVDTQPISEEPKVKMVVPQAQLRDYLFSKVKDVPFKTLKNLKVDYMEVRKQSFEQVFQLTPQAQKLVGSKVQLHSARDPADNSLKIVVTNANKVSEFKFSLENVSLPDKISLHKQSVEPLYAELLQMALNHSKALKRNEQLE